MRDSRAMFDPGSRPERSGVEVVALDLDVESFVIHSKQPRRLALVSLRGLQGQPDRLPLGLGDRPIGNLLQRRALVSGLRMNLTSKHDARNSRANGQPAIRASRRP
jgi:hypothetical protein